MGDHQLDIPPQISPHVSRAVLKAKRGRDGVRRPRVALNYDIENDLLDQIYQLPLPCKYPLYVVSDFRDVALSEFSWVSVYPIHLE